MRSVNYNLHGSPDKKISAREQKNMVLAREAAREGIVLLKNSGALPLKNKKVALYGAGAKKTIKGGTGSGSVNERHSVTIFEGLQNAGYQITTQSYLNDYDDEFKKAYLQWHDGVEDKIAGLPPIQALLKGLEIPFRYPCGREITESDIENSGTDTAIYVVARQAGENKDRREEAGDYRLTKTEYANISKISSAYKNTILIINVGGMIDLSFLDNIKGINAVVYFVQGGMEGGNALADILSGKYTFSGKLTDTWAKHYPDYPNAKTYSYLNGNLQDENYTEGIYVGYRYFDTFGIEPRYPFGFGLSYTDFSLSVKKVLLTKSTVNAEVEVKNIGKTYAGKEVVQAYLSCPDGKLKKEYQRLVCFFKTKDLKPGETQKIVLSFDFSKAAASYDETASAWIIENGDYILKIGNSSRNTSVAAVLTLGKNVVIEQCRPCCAPLKAIEEISAPQKTQENIPDGVTHITVEPSVFVTKINNYKEPDFTETELEKKLLDSLSQNEMAELLQGGNLVSPSNELPTGVSGKTAISLKNKGIPAVAFADGPAGLKVTSYVLYDESGAQKPAEFSEEYNYGSFRGMMKKIIDSASGTSCYRYATAWPVATLLAQTWDPAIVENVGKAVGEEMIEFGITLWLAPALNIHRNPLCGRNFEYYSEDPLIAGTMAAAITNGIHCHQGIGTTIKHFACNNQEDNRYGVSSNVSERALREIYLKGFEIAVKDGSPSAVMTSYNRLNEVYTANRHDLNTDILRCEWGFNGMVMTDWDSCDPGRGKPELCAPAGNDLVMPGNGNDKEKILAAIKKGSITPAVLRRCACRVLRVILESKNYIKP